MPRGASCVAYALAPAFVVEIPAHCFFQTACETLGGAPVEFSRDAVDLHGVAPVMAGPVFDEGDQIAVGSGATARHKAVEEIAHRLDDGNICALGATADAINATRRADVQNPAKRARMIFDIEPITHLPTVAIKRQSKRALPGAGEMIRRRLAGGIG